MEQVSEARIRALAEGLADGLQATQGVPAEPGWREALLAVPRHLFVPVTGWASPDSPGAAGYRIDRDTDPDAWWGAVYSDASIITQRADGAGDAGDGKGGQPSSSLSAPGVAFAFLDLLRPRDHDRVLEIGTGTGYTAAVLSARLGHERVTTVEVDAGVARTAATSLETAGYSPRLVVADGAAGYPEGAPYDRVHATCGVAEIPYTWVEQTRPGGVIVAPWQPRVHHGWMVRLTVADGSAHGRFHGTCGYMMLRAQRAAVTWHSHHAENADQTATRLDPRTVYGAEDGAALALTARVPRLGMYPEYGEDGAFSLLLFEVGNPAGSWAACDYEPGTNAFDVTQYGERRLWNELEDAFLWWISAGSPELPRYGLTVTPEAQQLWLDQPTNPIEAP